MTFDREGWEERWSRVARDRLRGPNPHLTQALAASTPGRALDAGCGHGAEALWLAARGWQVTGVDFSATALEHARAGADRLCVQADWIEADLSDWSPPEAAFDLVISIFFNILGPTGAFVGRLAAGVAPGGSLLMVGRPAAAGQTQIDVGRATAALEGWDLRIAETRGEDAVVLARRPT